VDEVYLGRRQKFITVADDLESAAPVFGGERKQDALDASKAHGTVEKAWRPFRLDFGTRSIPERNTKTNIRYVTENKPNINAKRGVCYSVESDLWHGLMRSSELRIFPRGTTFSCASERTSSNPQGETGAQAVFGLKPALRLDCTVLTSTFHLAINVHVMENGSMRH
jgi:hypothetical protein